MDREFAAGFCKSPSLFVLGFDISISNNPGAFFPVKDIHIESKNRLLWRRPKFETRINLFQFGRLSGLVGNLEAAVVYSQVDFFNRDSKSRRLICLFAGPREGLLAVWCLWLQFNLYPGLVDDGLSE